MFLCIQISFFINDKNYVLQNCSECSDFPCEHLYPKACMADVAWIEATNMPPVREDMTENAAFNDYWAAHPVVKMYAEGVPYSVPPALIATTVEVQRIMGTEMIEPIWFGTKEPEQAMADAVKAVEEYLQANE